MELSVILITWNSEQDVPSCLDSLLNAVQPFESEVIVIDNGSTDQTYSLLSAYQPRIILQRNETNLGVAKARNIGLKQAKGKNIWILDIDTIVNPTAIAAMMDYLVINPEIGICGCKLISTDGGTQDSCRKFPTPINKSLNVLSSLTGRTKGLRTIKQKIEDLNKGQFYKEQLSGSEPFEVEYLIGACQLFSQKTLKAVGWLDENIFYGPEDADFCFRVHLMGGKCVCLPQVHIIHHYNRITNKKLLSKISFLHLKALIYYFLKYR